MVQKRIYVIIIFCVLTFTHTINSQVTTDTLQSKSYKELYRLFFPKFRTKDSITVKSIAKIFLNKAKNDNDTIKIAIGYKLYSYITKDMTKIMYYDSIINITKHKQTKIYPSNIYYLKAQFYFYQKRNIDEAINNINYARKYANLNNNEDLVYRLDYLIGVIKSEHLNQKKEAIKIFKKCASYYQQELKKIHLYRYLYTIHIIAETYTGLQKNDSATFYNNIGYQKATKNIDPIVNKMKSMFSISEAINQFHLKNYQKTIDSITKSIPNIIALKEIPSIINSYFYLGQSYYHLNDSKKAIHFFIKTDSILKTLESLPEYKHAKTYEYLKNHYKNKGDNLNHNIYLTKLNTVLSHYIDDKIHISTMVKQDYDIPLLLDEQKTLIKRLNKTNNSYSLGILLLVLLLFMIMGLIYYQYHNQKRYIQRFNKLMHKQNNTDTKNSSWQKTEAITKKELDIPKHQIQTILEKLNSFETQHEYLSQELSSRSLATKMNTNVRYLSKVINHYKNKTFTNYLNELRITYAIDELRNNTALRKYTIKAIAEEMGYQNAETFSKAFVKQTGIKPSYFIDQLVKQQANE